MTAHPLELSAAKHRLLEKLLAGEAEAPISRAPIVTPRSRDAGPPPISPEQTQVWFHAAMAEDVPLYNEPMTIHRRGSFELACLEESVNSVLRRHEIWRTSFRLVEGSVRQIVEHDVRVSLPLVDLTHLPEAERMGEAQRLATEHTRKPFDLARAPLLRALVIKLAPDYHRLHLALHHIIFDGVSIYRIFLPELVAGYEAIAGGHAVPVSRPQLQYGDYAVWRQRSLADEEISRQMTYWRTQLAGELPSPRLPTDHARPAQLRHRGAMEAFILPADLTTALNELGRAEQATLYMVLLAAFKALLYRYSGLEDLVVGGVVDLRRRPELEDMMGYFLNSIALRTHPSGAMPFRDYLAQVKLVVLDSLAASDVPFDHVVRELHPRRDGSHHPLFDVMFLTEPPGPAFEGWDLSQTEVTVGTAKFDLYVEMDERPDRIMGRIVYSTDLFEAPTIHRMIDHWTRLLRSIVAEPERTLASLSILPDSEAHQLLTAWNDTARAVPSVTLADWFSEQVSRTPDRIALRFEDACLSYRDLDNRAEQLASRLRAHGMGRDRLVGICVERSLDMVVGLLAILKAGAAYLPLDPETPKARLELIIQDAGPAALLTRRNFLARLPEVQIPVLFLEQSDDARTASAGDGRGADPESLAYVLYTSGSTGKPKGVEVPHRALVNLLASMQLEPGLGGGDTLLAVTSLSFDIAALEIFLPLVSGGTVVLASSGALADPGNLVTLIQRSRCTHMQATPTMWRSVIEAGWSGGPGLKILCGGEALPRRLADALLARCGSLWNIYGPTETTVWSTVQRVDSGTGPPPIGRPIANTRVYIVDPEGSPVPIGVAGELLIAGSGLARGYRNHDALTRERFVTSTALPGERLYRTGDLARWHDGTLEYLGRTDQQVKVRGFRIAPEEIEAALGTHPRVSAAAVRCYSDKEGEQSLVAYVVQRGLRAPEPSELRQHLSQILPTYMLPSRIVTLTSLPTTPNGKLDRKRLPKVDVSSPLLDVQTPQDDHERRLAEIWRELLGVDQVGRNEDFFDLGGHSLLAAKLLRRIDACFGVRLPMASILHAPTLAQMAALVSARGSRPTQPVQLRPAASAACLLWINGGPAFRHLHKIMEQADWPLVSVPIEPEDLLGQGEGPSVGEIAARLVERIRSVQPTGPYYIGGWCVDGIIAFEAAAQLMSEGAHIGSVVLLHSPNPLHYQRMGASSVRLSKLKYHWKKIRRLRGPARWSYAAARLRGAAEPVTPWLPTSVLQNAALKYEPRSYRGSVLLLQPIERPSILDYRQGWEEVVTGTLQFFVCPGDHNTMLEPPNVEILAGRIRAHLGSTAVSAASLPKAARR